jgi:DNA-binding GntR family transcriptional regulator
MLASKKARQGLPAHQRVADDLRSALTEGLFEKEKPMPTEAELVQVYNLSRQTLR